MRGNEKKLYDALLAVRTWDVDNYIHKGKLSLPLVLRTKMQAALKAMEKTVHRTTGKVRNSTSKDV